MIVVDTSAFISLATINTLKPVLDEFEVHTTETVVDELEETADYEDIHGHAARTVLDQRDRITVHPIDTGEFRSNRVDPGEGSCALLTKQLDARFLITDDLKALPELQTVSDANVAISPIVLNALVKKDVLDQKEAIRRLETLAEDRSWLGAPIYRRARDLFEDDND